MTKRLLLGLIVSMLFLSVTVNAQTNQNNIQVNQLVDVTNHHETMLGMLDEVLLAREILDGRDRAYIDNVANSGDPLYIAPLIDLAFFVRFQDFAYIRDGIFHGLRQLTDLDYGEDWGAYFRWASEENIPLPPHYDEFKGVMFGQLVDARFAQFFEAGVGDDATVNMMEAVWGGVRVDGIPSLVNARQISPEEAMIEGEMINDFCNNGDCRYPAPDELVFGVSINGDNRAYPLRILNWHEMFNDVIGSAPLYDVPNGEVVCNFRAPRNFRAVARQGDNWVQIMGDSAGCPFEGGWLENPDSLVWIDVVDWAEAQSILPDLADDTNTALLLTEGIVAQVDGTPVMMAYCTLCGSGILFDPIIDDMVIDGESMGRQVLEFGSTGLLMRSNKLMYDRTTLSVWNHITGEAVWGDLVGTRLDILPMVTIDWATWLEQHPDTSVLSLQTGYPRNYTNGAAYANYFNNTEDTMFPVWQTNTEQVPLRDMVFAIVINDIPKAYPLNTIIEEAVTNDTIDDQYLVLVTQATPERDFFEPGGATVRAYDRQDYTFTQGSHPLEVVDQDGGVWQVTEDALVREDGETLARLPGHLAFWFGWYSFRPETLIYGEVE